MDAERYARRRAAVEKWKLHNREYYLKQKRDLSRRPSYRKKVREMYKEKRNELIQAGLAPRQVGRPRMYGGEEAVSRRKEINRLASARYRRRKTFSPLEKNNESSIESESEIESASEDRC